MGGRRKIADERVDEETRRREEGRRVEERGDVHNKQPMRGGR